MSTSNLLHVSFLTNPEAMPETRVRGISTGLALRFISEAILRPNTKIVVKDHIDVPHYNKKLLRRMERIVKTLQLIGFEVGFDTMLGRDYVRCNLIVEKKEA